jgi:hypothetical protein
MLACRLQDRIWVVIVAASRPAAGVGRAVVATDDKEVRMWQYNPWTNTWAFVPYWTPPAAYFTPWGQVVWVP